MLAPNHRSLALGALTAGLVLGASGLLASRHPALSLLLPLAALLLLAVVLRPEWGFYAIVFMVPLESFRGLSESFESLTISKLLGMAVAGAFLLRWVHDKRLPPQLRSNLWPWILTWLAATLLSTVLSPFPASAIGGLRILATAIVFFALSLATHQERHYRVTTPWVLALSVSLSAAIALLSAPTGSIESLVDPVDLARTAGAAGSPNHFAAMLVLSLPVLVHLLVTSRGPLRILVVAIGMLCLAALVLGFSRSGLIALVFTLALIGWHYLRYLQPRHYGLLITAGAALTLAATILIPGIYWTRQVSVTDTTDPSIGRRASYLVVALQTVVQRPVLGTGLETFREHFATTGYAAKYAADGSDYRRYAHNTYVEVAVGTGALGLFCFLALIIAALRNFTAAAADFRETGRAELAELTWAYRTAMLSLLVYFLFLSDVTHKLFWLLAALSQVGVTLVSRRRETER